MEHVQIVERKPTVEEFRHLRGTAGWYVPAADVAAAALARSVYGVVAERGGQAVGMARIVGDGRLINYVQDVIVHPDYQRQGIGDRLVKSAMAFLQRTAAGSDVALISAPGKEGFYQRYGFALFPADKPGLRMRVP